MNNNNFDVYFDYGSSKIRAAAICSSNKLNNFYYESAYFSDYLKSNFEIEKIISSLEKDTDEYLNSINLMIDSPEMISIGLSVSKKFDGKKLQKEDIQFLIQNAKQQILENYSNLNIIHIIVKNYKIENINYSSIPLDVHCKILSLDIIFICLPKKIVDLFKTVFLKFNISINQIFCSSYAKSVNYKNNFSTNENISFIDMGFNKTSIIYYEKDKISFFHTIPIGGNHITKDLSKILEVDLTDAEQIKLNFDKDKDILIKRNFSLELIQKIIFARAEEILEICSNSIKLNENFNISGDFKMILMGEGSQILDNKFKEQISFSQEINLLEETTEDICESALKLHKGFNKQEVMVVPKKPRNKGFFEKIFNFF